MRCEFRMEHLVLINFSFRDEGDICSSDFAVFTHLTSFSAANGKCFLKLHTAEAGKKSATRVDCCKLGSASLIAFDDPVKLFESFDTDI